MTYRRQCLNICNVPENDYIKRMYLVGTVIFFFINFNYYGSKYVVMLYNKIHHFFSKIKRLEYIFNKKWK